MTAWECICVVNDGLGVHLYVNAAEECICAVNDDLGVQLCGK